MWVDGGGGSRRWLLGVDMRGGREEQVGGPKNKLLKSSIILNDLGTNWL